MMFKIIMSKKNLTYILIIIFIYYALIQNTINMYIYKMNEKMTYSGLNQILLKCELITNIEKPESKF